MAMATAAVQRRRTPRGPASVSKTTPTCLICFDPLAVPSQAGGRLLRSSSKTGRFWLDCEHHLCRPCLSQYAATSVSEGKTAGRSLECPVTMDVLMDCDARISETMLKQLLSAKDWAKHVRLAADRKVATDPRLRHCPMPDCSGIARLSPASLALLSASASNVQYVQADCDVCHHVFCAKCGAGAHPDEACEDMGDTHFFRWKQGKPVKPCPSCRYQTEKRGGCGTMTCVKCGAMWCFTCEFAFAPLELCPCEKNEMWRMKRRKAWRTIKNAMLYVLGGGFAMVMFGLIARVLVPHSQLAFEVAIFEGALVGAVCIDWYLH